MKRFLTTAALGAVLATGVWALCHRDQIHNVQDALRLAQEQFSVGELFEQGSDHGTSPFLQSDVPAQFASWSQTVPNDRLRLATFNIQSLGASKANRPEVVENILKILSRFDLIAIQEIRNLEQNVIPSLVMQLNALTGRQYVYRISLPAGRSDHYREQSAFVFDQARVWLDDATAYSIQDPQDLLIRQPYVGWFRAAAPPPDRAFTFSVVNVHLDSRRSAEELEFLREVFRAVRQDGRGEDDVIILGDFNAGDKLLEASTLHLQMMRIVNGSFTNTRGTSQYDNILFDSLATTEYLGNGGVFDFLKHLNLSMDQALEVSDHLPVWADFSVLEGGHPAMLPRSAEKTSQDSGVRQALQRSGNERDFRE